MCFPPRLWRYECWVENPRKVPVVGRVLPVVHWAELRGRNWTGWNGNRGGARALAEVGNVVTYSIIGRHLSYTRTTPEFHFPRRWIPLPPVVVLRPPRLAARANVPPGTKVEVVQKQHQRSGQLTAGVVSRLLTNSVFHPRGIKVFVLLLRSHAASGAVAAA